MKASPTKVVVTTVLGVAVLLIGIELLLGQKTAIEPFDYLSFLTGLAAFVFALSQVFLEAAAKENQRQLLMSLLESAKANIARVHQFSLRQSSSRNVSEMLVGVLQQEQVHIAGLLKAQHGTDAPLLDLDAVLPAGTISELINGQDNVRTALEELTREARDYIYIVGGRSRDKEYLACLLTRLQRGDLEYMRIVTGDHIREPLFNHLHDVEGLRQANENLQFRIGYLQEDKYGSFTVTRDAIFWALPSSTATQLTSGVRIYSADLASDFRAHVVALAGGQNDHKDLRFFQHICKDFWPNGVQPPEAT